MASEIGGEGGQCTMAGWCTFVASQTVCDDQLAKLHEAGRLGAGSELSKAP